MCAAGSAPDPSPLKPRIQAFVDDEAGAEVADKVTRRLQHFIDRKVAALFEPLSCVVGALERVRVRPGDNVAIIGAGPIGIELAVALKRAGLDYLHFDARQIGDTISRWPRQTYFFSTTERIELAGVPIPNIHQGRITGEEYLAYLRGLVEQFDLAARCQRGAIVGIVIHGLTVTLL